MSDDSMAHILDWAETVYGPVDMSVVLKVIRDRYSPSSSKPLSVQRFDSGVYHASVGRGSGLGLTEEEAILQAAYDAWMNPLMEQLNDINIDRYRAYDDINQEFEGGALDKPTYDARASEIEARYKELMAAAQITYSSQVEHLSKQRKSQEGES